MTTLRFEPLALQIAKLVSIDRLLGTDRLNGLPGDGPGDPPLPADVRDFMLASFELSPVIQYKNGFVPRAEGRVVPHGEGSTVIVRMRMLPFARFFMTVWLIGAIGMLLAVAAGALTDAAKNGFAATHAVLVVFIAIFPTVGLVLPRYGFGKEARPLEEFLRATLES